MKHMVLPFLVVVLGVTVGQGITPVPAEAALQEEAAELRGVELNGVRYVPPTALDLMLSCTGGGAKYGYVDQDRDGYVDTLRVFGADMVNAQQYAEAGVMVLGPLRDRATLKAQAAVSQAAGVFVSVQNNMLDEFSADLTNIEVYRTLTGAVRATADQMIRGAALTGTRIISLANDEGVCVVVRYDAPVHLNNLPAGRTAPPDPRTSTASEGGARHAPPPPGMTGDF